MKMAHCRGHADGDEAADQGSGVLSRTAPVMPSRLTRENHATAIDLRQNWPMRRTKRPSSASLPGEGVSRPSARGLRAASRARPLAQPAPQAFYLGMAVVQLSQPRERQLDARVRRTGSQVADLACLAFQIRPISDGIAQARIGLRQDLAGGHADRGIPRQEPVIATDGAGHLPLALRAGEDRGHQAAGAEWNEIDVGDAINLLHMQRGDLGTVNALVGNDAAFLFPVV